MTRSGNRLRAAFFDLDGTLLDLDVDTFLPPYLDALTGAVAGYVPAERFRWAVIAAVQEVERAWDGRATNEERFWAAFERLAGVRREEIAVPVQRFYAEEFPRLGHVARRLPNAADVVASVRQRVEVVVLATNPIFPQSAIATRMEWAGLDPSLFDFVTTYEVMRSTKPHARYYEEICERFGLDPAEVVMIGNNPESDIAGAAEAGLWTYLVEDLTAPPSSFPEFTLDRSAPHGRGALADVPAFVQHLQERSSR